MTLLLVAFVTLCIMAVVFSLMPVLPGPPFAMIAIMMIPFWPDLAVEPDQVMWWVSASMAVLGLVITIIDIAAPYLAKLYEGVLQERRRAAIGSAVGLLLSLLSLISACSGVAIPVLAALPLPLVLVTPFFGALAGEATVTGPPGELGRDRTRRLSALPRSVVGPADHHRTEGRILHAVLPVGYWLIARACKWRPRFSELSYGIMRFKSGCLAMMIPALAS